MEPRGTFVARPRQQRAIANDLRILEAGEALLGSDGWEDCAVSRIAERAQLSRRAVLDRYGDRAGVTAAVWRERLSPALEQALAEVIASHGPVPTPDDADRLARALEPFLDPSATLRAVSEVLIVSCFQPDVSQAVHATMDDDWGRWLSPGGARLSSPDAARNAFLIALALGVLLESRAYPDGLDLDLSEDLAMIAVALHRDVDPTPLPIARAEHLERDPDLDADPNLSSLLAATLRLVGEDGYEAATIDRIAAACGRTSGLVYSHYDHKRQLFLDATDRLLTRAEALNHDFQAGIAAQASWGIADATLTREIMRPDFVGLRTIALEQYRLSWHDGDFLDAFLAARSQSVEHTIEAHPGLSWPRARARSFIGLARGIGLALLAQLVPHAWSLPHDVVSVPLVDD